MNPEFRRNLWLEFSIERLLIVPAVAALSAMAVSGVFAQQAAATFATYGAIAMAIVWGSTQAGSSYLGEITARTWDMQRGSSLSGWQMAWGKLFGATAYSWYGVAVAFVVWIALKEPEGPGRGQWAALLPAAVVAQATALITGIYLAFDGRIRARGTRLSAVAGIVAGLVVIQSLVRLESRDAADWFRLDLHPWVVMGGSAAFLCFWSVVGAWRTMAAAMQIPLGIWAWPAFLVTGSVWLAGFAAGVLSPESTSQQLFVAFAAMVGATWLAALVDVKSPVRLRQLGAANISLAIRLAPAWLVGLPIVLAVAVAVALVGPPGLAPVAMPALFSRIAATMIGADAAWLLALSAVLFLSRDIAIMYWAGLGRVPALVYLAVLYIPVPAALFALGAADLIPAFVPPFAGYGMSGGPLLVLIIQVAIAMGLAARAIFRHTRMAG